MNKCAVCKSHHKRLIEKIGAYAGKRPIYYLICQPCEKKKWLDGIHELLKSNRVKCGEC